MEKLEITKTKEQIQLEWLDLCKYVHDEILQYNSDLKFPKHLALRLKGLSKGNFMANKKNKPLANYDYQTILYTFKACKLQILQYMISNQTKFVDEKHKINTIMIFIENNINDMVIRLQNAKKAKEKTANIPLDNQAYEGVEYKSKNKEIIKELEELW